MQTVEELANYFVLYITQARFSVKARTDSAISSIQVLLNKGWTLQEIKEELDNFSKTYPQIVTTLYHVEEIMKTKELPNNLLSPTSFYYHNILREVPPPPILKRDPNSGNWMRVELGFYLEMKNRFTLQDLLNYWYEKMDIIPNDHLIKQDEGKFKYMLGNYTVDELLFMIDVAKVQRKEKQLRTLRNAFELEKYLEEARDFIQRKENIHKVTGINREIKRHAKNSDTAKP
ncbi:hypothetical protein [Bacillus mobilis]|uniref:hypothetical protein n=1 Tax=Bacillus mobilis TaxID=2026190 RepID=UPI0036B97BF1